MRFARTGVVFRKELLDGVRDRRAIMSLLISSLVGPLIVSFMIGSIAERARSAEDVKVPVAGAEFAPGLIDWLQQQSGVEIVPAPRDPEAAVRDGQQDLVVLIDKEFGRNFGRSLPGTVRLVGDATRDSARQKVTRVRRLLNAYSAEIGSLRLVARGISPAVASAVRVEDVEVSSSQQRAAKLLGFLPMFVLMAAFVGVLQVASDSTAGERERGSLEPLLLNPVPRESFVAGKWLAASLFGCAAVVFSAGLSTLAVSRIPLQDLGARFRFGPEQFFSLLALGLPLALFGSALVIFFSMFARSYKEAQSYLSVVVLIPMLPGMLSMLYPMDNRPWLAPVPVVGQFALASDVIGGSAPHPAYFLLAAVSIAAVALLLVLFTTRLLLREKIVFGR